MSTEEESIALYLNSIQSTSTIATTNQEEETIPEHLLSNSNFNSNSSNLFQDYPINQLNLPKHRLSEDQINELNNSNDLNNLNSNGNLLINNYNSNNSTKPLDFTNLQSFNSNSNSNFDNYGQFGFDYYDQSSNYSDSGQYTPSYGSFCSETSSLPPSSNYSHSPYLNPIELDSILSLDGGELNLDLNGDAHNNGTNVDRNNMTNLNFDTIGEFSFPKLNLNDPFFNIPDIGSSSNQFGVENGSRNTTGVDRNNTGSGMDFMLSQSSFSHDQSTIQAHSQPPPPSSLNSFTNGTSSNSSHHIYPGTLSDSPPNSFIPLPPFLPSSDSSSPSSNNNFNGPLIPTRSSSYNSRPSLATLNIPPSLESNSNQNVDLSGPSLNLIEPTPSTARPPKRFIPSRPRPKGQGTLELENLLGVSVDSQLRNDEENDSEHDDTNFNPFNYPPISSGIPTSSERDTLSLGGIEDQNHQQNQQQFSSNSNSNFNFPSTNSNSNDLNQFSSYSSPLLDSLTLPRTNPIRQRSKSDSDIQFVPPQAQESSTTINSTDFYELQPNLSNSEGYQPSYNFPYAYPTPEMIVKNQNDLLESRQQQQQYQQLQLDQQYQQQQQQQQQQLQFELHQQQQQQHHQQQQMNFENELRRRDIGGPGYAIGLNSSTGGGDTSFNEGTSEGGAIRHRRTQSHGILNRRSIVDSNRLGIPIVDRPRSRNSSRSSASNRSRSPSPSGSVSSLGSLHNESYDPSLNHLDVNINVGVGGSGSSGNFVDNRNRSLSPNLFQYDQQQLHQQQIQQHQQLQQQQQFGDQQQHQIQYQMPNTETIGTIGHLLQHQQNPLHIPIYPSSSNISNSNFDLSQLPPQPSGSNNQYYNQSQPQGEFNNYYLSPQQQQQQQLNHDYDLYSSSSSQHHNSVSPLLASTSTLPPSQLNSSTNSNSKSTKKSKPSSYKKKVQPQSRSISPSLSNAGNGTGEISIESKTTAATIEAALKRRAPGVEAKFVCSFCGETFTRRYNLNGHERSHLNIRPYKCDFPGCSKAFARMHDRVRHSKIHFSARDYHCHCGKDFIRLDALQRHHRNEAGYSCVVALRAAGIVIGYDTIVDTKPNGGGAIL